ncbi:MAG: FtsK/SpoIIIE domain-containing protein, partial [Myxococcales bacterium]
CERQMVLAREGYRIVEGDGGIGQAAHAVLAGFVSRGAGHPLLETALVKQPLDEASLLHAAVEALHRELFDRAATVARNVAASELVRLGRITFDLGSLAGELLVRARRAGRRGTDAFTGCFEDSERRVELTLDGGAVRVSGALDLRCRDLETGERYVFDLKTGVADCAAEEQVRLYALALACDGESGSPALACISGGELALRRVPPLDGAGRRALDERVHRLSAVVAREAIPGPAPDPETCRGCAVQKPCWSRWGRTLSESVEPPKDVPSGEIAQDALKLEKSLRAHRIHLDRVDPALAVAGPNVTRYLVSLRDGEGIAKVERSARDLQRAMGWPVAPLVSNHGGYVAIDGPRREREIVPWKAASLEELHGLEVPVGLTLERELLKLDLASAPHLLVAGTTNSGKTVFLKGLLLSLLQRLSRDECEVAIIDPKMVDFPPFAALSLRRPVITDPQEAVAFLQDLVDGEMPRRTLRLVEAGVTSRTEIPPGASPMPAIVVVIDEFADLLAMFPDRSAKAEFVASVQRLLQRARAVGIHLVIATQRPSVEAVPGQLKANLPVRVAFKLPTAIDSSTVLDEPGAENLLGKGDLLLKRDGQTFRAQAFHVTADDIQGR